MLLGQCRYVTCSWNPWSEWSATCGVSIRTRTPIVTQHVINKPSCEGLQKSCPRAEREKKISNCECDHRVFREPTTEKTKLAHSRIAQSLFIKARIGAQSVISNRSDLRAFFYTKESALRLNFRTRLGVNLKGTFPGFQRLSLWERSFPQNICWEIEFYWY